MFAVISLVHCKIRPFVVCELALVSCCHSCVLRGQPVEPDASQYAVQLGMSPSSDFIIAKNAH